MSIIGSNVIAGASGQAGYNLNNSLRFRSSASAYLSRTPAGAGSGTTWTWSGWVKLGALSAYKGLFERFVSGTEFHTLAFTNSNVLRFYSYINPTDYGLDTTAVFRDPSAWYHVVAVFDTTNATAADRMRLYVNGVRITAFSDFGSPTQNYVGGWNGATLQTIGRYQDQSGFTDGYMTEINFIDGQALTPSSFGETNTTTGSWKPKAYTGTYGTNGFYLKFSDIATTSGSNAGLGKDFSGNANYWTTNNISVTAGTTYDAMLDVPTNTSATVANYSVLNPLSTLHTVTAGNLDFTYTNSTNGVWYLKGTLAVSSDKYYWEVTPTNVGAGQNISIGVILSSNTQTNTTTISLVTDGYVYSCDGNKYSGSSGAVAYGATYTNNDVIGVALDLTAGTLVFYKNNVSQGTAFTGLTSSYMQLVCSHLGGTSRTVAGSVNAGQRPFSYTPPTGYVALNTFNLPTPTILQGNKYMDATLYTGTGASLAITNAGAFKPDFVWVKGRSGATDHALYDSVRGTTKQLESNTSTAETTEATGLTAFGTGGFTVGALAQMNTSAATYVGWQWQGGQSSGVSNTSGTITSTVSASTTAGFSVFTYTGNATVNATIGHGLGVAPKMFIVKARSTTSEGLTYHASTGKDGFMQLYNTDAFTSSANYWGSTGPTSTTIQINGGGGVNNSGTTYVVWCWAEIAGYSAFGSYTGNGSADGPFVFTNFRPKFILIKQSSSAGNAWQLLDSARNTYNKADNVLFPNTTGAETTGNATFDFLSNGFKVRTTDGTVNTSSSTYIYMAFAENPFKNANAR